jgi:hypothetical protein
MTSALTHRHDAARREDGKQRDLFVTERRSGSVQIGGNSGRSAGVSGIARSAGDVTNIADNRM